MDEPGSDPAVQKLREATSADRTEEFRVETSVGSFDVTLWDDMTWATLWVVSENGERTELSEASAADSGELRAIFESAGLPKPEAGTIADDLWSLTVRSR